MYLKNLLPERMADIMQSQPEWGFISLKGFAEAWGMVSKSNLWQGNIPRLFSALLKMIIILLRNISCLKVNYLF